MDVFVKDYVFILYNPKSGNRQGQHLENYDIQFYRLKSRPWVHVQMFNVVSEAESYVDDVRRLLDENKSTVHVWSAGGDGTFVAAIRTLYDHAIDIFHPKLTFSCIPFGTGNDLSQSVGWGASVSVSTTQRQSLFNKEIIRRLDGRILKMDLWRIDLLTHEDGWCKVKGTGIKVKDLHTLMGHYMSIGLQGEVGRSFEQRRHRSRYGNVWEYALASVHQLFKSRVLRVGHFFKNMTVGDTQFTLQEDMNKNIEFIVQNLYGIWGRRINLWETCVYQQGGGVLRPKVNEADVRNWSPKVQMDDGRLEVMSIRSRWDYLLKQIPSLRMRGSLPRLGQFGDFTLNFKDDSPNIHYMIDGEFMTAHRPASLCVTRFGQINMLVNDELSDFHFETDTESRSDVRFTSRPGTLKPDELPPMKEVGDVV